MLRTLPWALALCLTTACGDPTIPVEPADSAGPAVAPPAPSTEGSAVEAMRALAAELVQRGENGARLVRLRTLFVGAPSGPGANGTQLEDLERHVANLLQRARAGEDFEALVEEYSHDRQQQVLTITDTSRYRMKARGFGEIGFLLEPGEIGVVLHSAEKSPRGWYVVQRVE